MICVDVIVRPRWLLVFTDRASIGHRYRERNGIPDYPPATYSRSRHFWQQP
ncbi:hypothetical protein V5738_14890 [Salinisphaera sp. SPP-AMP-43]|uniref:hypothetical protein n=1 Tax=Salinisphaera sp. SPP-AMP-43 TaxID=3121288 RepID=UPI003C6E3BB5